MPVEFYKVLHLCGILMLFSGLAALWGVYSSGTAPAKNRRLALAMIHGFGMLFVLVGGFGMAAKLGMMSNLPVWIYLKLSIWLLLGGSMVLAKRKSQWGPGLLLFWVALGTSAAYLALYKPV
ncbi:MAG: hypothetical protein ACXVA9_12475 [Bdellovibrionales bacterium]